jgi:hypothetical protein
MSEQTSNATSTPGTPQADVEPATRQPGGRHFPDTLSVDEKQIAQRLAMSFSTLMIGATYPSENDYPYEPFWVELRPEEPLTRQAFCQLLGLEPSPDMVWTNPSPRQPPPGSGYEAELESVLWNILLLTMRSLLGQVTEVLARGEHIVQVPYFLFGRLTTGALVGVRSISIET